MKMTKADIMERIRMISSHPDTVYGFTYPEKVLLWRMWDIQRRLDLICEKLGISEVDVLKNRGF